MRPSLHRSDAQRRGSAPRPGAVTYLRAGDPDYEARRHTYLRRGSPGEIALPHDAEGVSAVLARARRIGLPLAVRSGGHGISGRSTNDGGLVLDLSRLSRIETPTEDRTVRIGPGALWGDVAHRLDPFGLAISSGDTGDVGVGGLATAGGIGFLARRWGLTIDRIRAVEVVLADGSHVRADGTHLPDLFWAIRGAGANFGVVTAFEIEGVPVRELVVSDVVHDATDTAALLERWGSAIEQAPRDLTSFLTLIAADNRRVARSISVYALQASAEVHAATLELAPPAMAALSAVAQAAPVLHERTFVTTYAELVRADHSPHTAQQSLSEARSALLNDLSPATSRSVADVLRAGAAPMAQLRSVGGAVNDVDPWATSYAHRHQNFSLMAVTHPTGSEVLDRAWSMLRDDVDGSYLSFETRVGARQLADAYPADTLARLRDLKAHYDPTDLFNTNFAI